ncbi:hypothetical protein B1H19_32720 [Streptomyces gilvosporeus]|uniref:DUF1266 domain-containing protein n=2 Tax=Streptomyces gilvosporeus TaxID=553510 RepID=A0A1V0TZB1_9ACTN|nr:hypothetical protein B1H19_32720 [Streptomyces gilvosporeus]
MPPTETERRLCEATARGDWNGQIAAIAGEDLYLAAPQQGQDPLPVYDDPATGGKCLPVLTRGMLPPWQPQQLFDRVTLDELAQDWPHDQWRLAVNPATPAAVYLAATPTHRASWRGMRTYYGVRPGGLLTTHYGGPLTGPLAQGLACGAPLAVHHSVPWNELGTLFLDPATDAQTLREQWSVTDPATWQQRLAQLLAGQFVPAPAEAALRRRAATDGGAANADGQPAAPKETGSSADAAQADAQQTGSTAGPAQSAAQEAELPELVTRYEDRFRTDGLLPPDGRVVSALALDLVHAVNLVRWGLSARLCAPQQAEQAVLEAGARARQGYGSWEEFAAGYALGRLLAYDQGWFGPQYAETLHLHRTLIQDPASPWRALPFA